MCLSWWVVQISLSNQSTVKRILTSGCKILRYPMGMDAHIAFKCRRHKRFPDRQIPPPMGILCNQLKALCVRLWSWRSLGASQLHATGPWPSVATGRLGSESVLLISKFKLFCYFESEEWGFHRSKHVLAILWFNVMVLSNTDYDDEDTLEGLGLLTGASDDQAVMGTSCIGECINLILLAM